jgi:hypothetical protein
MTKLTPNFDSREFDVHEPWPAMYAANRQRLAELAQWLRNLAGSPGYITSAYRNPARNDLVGGVKNSQHTKGEALDITFPLITDRELAARVFASEQAGTAPAYGQFILYDDTAHVHISLGTKREKLVGYRDANRVRRYRRLERPQDAPAPTLHIPRFSGENSGAADLVTLAVLAAFGLTVWLVLR